MTYPHPSWCCEIPNAAPQKERFKPLLLLAFGFRTEVLKKPCFKMDFVISRQFEPAVCMRIAHHVPAGESVSSTDRANPMLGIP